jgi:hypothetical protein
MEITMSIIQGLLGHASSTSTEEAKSEFGELLIRGEEVLSAYKWARDKIVFTTHRIIYEDVQGLTGRKRNYMSIPYGSIHKFSKESSGWLDLDAELRVWVRGETEPLKWEFRKDAAVNDIFKILSEGVLSG